MNWALELADDFVDDNEPRSWTQATKVPKGMTALEMYIQETNGKSVSSGLEVLLAETATAPKVSDVRAVWNAQWGRHSEPVLLIVAYPGGGADGSKKAAVCGSASENPPVLTDVDLDQATRIAVAALAEPDHHAAIRTMRQILPQLDPPFEWMKSGPIGLSNTGLFATQELISGVPERSDWNEAVESSQEILNLRGHELVKRLGFRIEAPRNHISKLTSAGETRAIALFCNEDEPFEAPSARLDGFTPVSRALAEAGRDPDNRISWVILTRGSEIRLYSALPDVGVSSKGRGETYVEINLIALPYSSAGYLQMLFSADALSPEGSVDETLEASERFAANLAYRLRERVYQETVPALAQAVATRLQRRSRTDDLSNIDLNAAYEQVMFILFRLLFVAYAEATDLLPYKTNDKYRAASLTTIIRELVEKKRSSVNDHAFYESFSERSTKLWDTILELWDAINYGNSDLDVPTYNGGLFSNDIDNSPIGFEISKLSKLKDSELGPALASMLIDEGYEAAGPVDFRALSVREFGTIYEGLIESQLVIQEGTIKFVNHSGEQKATGTYFTKQFVVEHLLDEALEPALDKHIEELSSLVGDEAALKKKFFDFKCADIAMGSGHFLVTALDRIETRLSAFLIEHQVPSVEAELQRLRSEAIKGLRLKTKKGLRSKAEEASDYSVDIETSSLLRRQVARHCVYGVDVNHIAVELARLSIWIHTFVPGLPLSFLDHNFVCGNSLTGVGTLEDAKSIYGGEEDSFFFDEIPKFLRKAEKSLKRLANTSDATKQEIDEARSAHLQAKEDVRSARSFFDLVTAERDPDCETTRLEDFSEEVVNAEATKKSVAESIKNLQPLHFPAAFPEVFIRDNPGFNVILGNPPWEKVKVETHTWWAIHQPGLKYLPKPKRDKEILKLKGKKLYLEEQFLIDVGHAKRYSQYLKSAFPNLGNGNTDLYKAFSWRIFQLTRSSGYSGIVLPRTILQTSGSIAWRTEIVNHGSFSSVITLLNKSGWVFDNIDSRYTVALIAISKSSEPDGKICFAGPFASHDEFDSYQQHEISQQEFLTWSDDMSFPSIPNKAGALKLFRKLRSHPRIDGKPSIIHQAPSTKHQAPSTKHQAPSTKHQAPSTKHQAPSRSPIPSCTRHSIATCSPIPRTRCEPRPSSISSSQQICYEERKLACVQGRVIQHVGARYRQLLRIHKSQKSIQPLAEKTS